jgi:hypothetical protein
MSNGRSSNFLRLLERLPSADANVPPSATIEAAYPRTGEGDVYIDRFDAGSALLHGSFQMIGDAEIAADGDADRQRNEILSLAVELVSAMCG